ncbi:hypothetical protein HW555_012447, partial [Spodoptera exigua]
IGKLTKPMGGFELDPRACKRPPLATTAIFTDNIETRAAVNARLDHVPKSVRDGALDCKTE